MTTGEQGECECMTTRLKGKKLTEGEGGGGGEEEGGGGGGGEKLPAAAASFFVACSLGN